MDAGDAMLYNASGLFTSIGTTFTTRDRPDWMWIGERRFSTLPHHQTRKTGGRMRGRHCQKAHCGCAHGAFRRVCQIRNSRDKPRLEEKSKVLEAGVGIGPAPRVCAQLGRATRRCALQLEVVSFRK